MISGINSYYAGVVGSVNASARPESFSQAALDTVVRNSDKVKPSGDGSARPVLSSGDTSLTAAASVVYEPTSLLVDLSGTAGAQKVTDPSSKVIPSGTYEQYSFKSSGAGEEPPDQPVAYTFETIV
jgi:hypothetical protein